MYTGKEIAELVGLQARHIWYEVRRRGIEPQKGHGVYVLDHAQLDLFLERRKSGYHVPRQGGTPRKKTMKRKPEPRQDKQETAVSGVTKQASNGQEYLYIPAPWPVPQAWQWGE